MFRVALAQMNSAVGDLEGNTQKILRFVEKARSRGADLAAFPEMAVTGYPAEDLLFNAAFIQDNLKAVERVVQGSKGLAVAVGHVDSGDGIYNAAAVARDGRLAGVHHKMLLPTYGVFDEDRYFRRGSACPVYAIGGVTVGVNVCEDGWFAEGPMRYQGEAGAALAVNLSASPYHVGKQREREAVMSARAVENGFYVAYVNSVGGQDELVFDGGSVVIDQKGRLLARGKQFEEDLVIVDLPLDGAAPDPGERPAPQPPPVHQLLEEEAEVYGALVTGLRDYVRKSGFSTVIVGLSGGIDSALTACIGRDALGPEGVKALAMPSRYSSRGSLSDAEALAQNLGVELWTIPIEAGHRAMLEMLEETFRGTESGVAEENVQSRIRGNLLMAVSNKFGWLVLTTGNKSEMAMGYATLYGDMAGGFAVLKDVPKTLVYRLARWRNRGGHPSNVIPQSVMDKPPSAELKPGQKDEDTLPPYPVLDGVIKAYVEEARSYQEIVGLGYDPQVARQVIAAVDRSEHKRRQAPPGVKITRKAFGKDRRLPIVNRYRQF